MKLPNTILSILIVLTALSCKNEKANSDTAKTNEISETARAINPLKIIPITHATMILETAEDVIYIDPTGGAEAFKDQKAPSLILITDIHGDHLSLKTLEALNTENATIIAPAAVVEKLPTDISKSIVTLNNAGSYIFKDMKIEAIPMYNLREEALKFHSKGRGNGYVLTINDERIYISGDTEDIPEMRSLKNIDKAFVCMNLPYTMTVDSAASAVLEFKPKTVYPYHYRGTEGFSDIEKFKKLINEGDNSIDVVFLKWY